MEPWFGVCLLKIAGMKPVIISTQFAVESTSESPDSQEKALQVFKEKLLSMEDAPFVMIESVIPYGAFKFEPGILSQCNYVKMAPVPVPVASIPTPAVSQGLLPQLAEELVARELESLQKATPCPIPRGTVGNEKKASWFCVDQKYTHLMSSSSRASWHLPETIFANLTKGTLQDRTGGFSRRDYDTDEEAIQDLKLAIIKIYGFSKVARETIPPGESPVCEAPAEPPTAP